MKNYKNFLLEKITKEDLVNIGDIVKVQVTKNNKPQKMYHDGIMKDEIILTDKDLKEFDSLEVETLPYTRTNTFVIIYCYYNGEPKILKMSVAAFKIFSEKLEIREKQQEEVRGTRIEAYQNLGLLYDKRTDSGELILPENGDIFKFDDFDFSLFEEEYVGVDFDDDNNLFYNPEDFMLLFGSIKFKNFMEHRHIYNKRHEFKFKKVIHKDKKLFLDSLLKRESEIVDDFGVKLNTDKGNTTDIVVSDDISIISKITDENNFVISEVSRRFEMNVNFKKANSKDTKKVDVFEGGVCYIFDRNLLKIEDLQNATDKEDWIKKLIKKYGENKPKFIQISLKKSKTGAQFGKVTKTIIDQFSDEVKNESVVGDFFRGVGNFFKKIYNKVISFFSKLNKEKDEIIEVETKMIVEDFVDKLNSSLVVEKKADEFFDYKPETLETKVIGDLFIYNEEPEEAKLKNGEIPNLQNKKFASSKIDTFIKNLEKTVSELKTDPKKLHDKFAEILTISLMGSTNLPLYMVFGTTEKQDLSFTLHTYRTDKKQKHIDDAIIHGDDKPPMYIAYIRNHMKNGVLAYKTLKVLIFNYSSTTDRYISVDMRTNSSSSRTFVAETTAPSDKVVDKVTNAYYKFKSK